MGPRPKTGEGEEEGEEEREKGGQCGLCLSAYQQPGRVLCSATSSIAQVQPARPFCRYPSPAFTQNPRTWSSQASDGRWYSTDMP